MAYSYKRAITIDHTKCGSANSTDFPVLVSFTDATFKTVGNGGRIQNASGYDINFYSDSALTTALNYECERFIATTGECIFWVKVPTLSYTADTVIYVGYGDSGISTFQGNINGTWNSNYKAVWHLPDGTTLGALDSTSGGFNGTLTNSPAAAAGKVGGGAGLVLASTQFINTGINSIDGTVGITVSAWINPSSLNTSQPQQIIAKWGLSSKTFMLRLNELNAKTFSFIVSDGTTSNGSSVTAGTAVANTWQYVVGVFDNANDLLTLYYNGVSIGTAAYTGTFGGTEYLAIGRMNYASGNYWYFGGSIDEPRVSKVPHSASWILSEYNNQSSPSTFFTLGSELSAIGNSTNFFQFM